ncbi:uncharacterized protein TNCV_2131411 [Trichonephila clavipes]|nr:uncharacterized protein TNCV_2131411 [Trichonephila clavipes]
MLNAETYLNRRCDDSARQGRGTEDCRGIDTGHGPQLAHPHCRNGSHPSTKGSLFGVFMEEHFRINCVGPVMFVMFLVLVWGCGSPLVKVSNHDRHVMSSNPVPLEIHRVGENHVKSVESSNVLPLVWWGS